MTDKSFSLINLDALSAPATKLIEAVQSATGAWFEPTKIRRKAKAEVDAAIIKAEGDIILQELAARASEWRNAQEIRRQWNRESIVGQSFNYLPESVSSEKVDPDWMVQFFQFSQDVGNEELQSLWARLLAGEVARPGSYSLRTLQTVKTLQKGDAELITIFCGYLWKAIEYDIHFYLFTDKSLKDFQKKTITYTHFLHLESLGILNLAKSGINYDSGEVGFFEYFGVTHKFFSLTSKKFTVKNYVLTDIGNELAPICGAKPDEGYRVSLIELLAEEGITTEVVEEAS